MKKYSISFFFFVLLIKRKLSRYVNVHISLIWYHICCNTPNSFSFINVLS